MPLDPEAAAGPDAGIFGLDCSRADAQVVLLPVPFDATTSGRAGTVDGPGAILRASHQVELYDVQTGRPYTSGIHLLAEDPSTRRDSELARRLCAPLIQKGGATEEDADHVRKVDEICATVHARVRDTVASILHEDRLPGVVGGDHSVALGCLEAVAERHPGLGVLQVDAHADLRTAFEGFRYSHASIMANALARVDGIARLVQVGLRDVSEGEVRTAHEDPRVFMHHDVLWRSRLAAGEPLGALFEEALAPLPGEVYVSFDIDGLLPSLCPNTGTPVPGGFSFQECCVLLQALVESGRRIVGFDLCEVAPGHDGQDWDGNVGARVLYKLCGFALRSRSGAF